LEAENNIRGLNKAELIYGDLGDMSKDVEDENIVELTNWMLKITMEV